MLPNDVWHEIADYLTINELLCLKSTNKEFNEILKDDLIKALKDHIHLVERIKKVLVVSFRFKYIIDTFTKNNFDSNPKNTRILRKIRNEFNEVLSFFINVYNTHQKDKYIDVMVLFDKVEKRSRSNFIHPNYDRLNFYLYSQRKCCIFDNNLSKLTNLCINNRLDRIKYDLDATDRIIYTNQFKFKEKYEPLNEELR